MNKIFSRLGFCFGVILLIIFSLYLYNVIYAANISTSALVNTSVSSGQTVNNANFSFTALGLNLANNPARSITSLKVTVAGPSPFNPAVDLNDLLSANDASGIYLGIDGTVAGGDGTYISSSNGDTMVALT